MPAAARADNNIPVGLMEWINSLPGTCLFHRMTGAPCPFCGTTRSIALLLDGRLGDSLEMAPFTLPLLAALAFSFAASWLERWRRHERRARGLVMTVFALMALQWIWRMAAG
ncbi:MAG: hypothetical protein GMKNLPBB_01048 [Myxococcota bacterium]|nr:hypothetical protein [Myxococcota bacterium]